MQMNLRFKLLTIGIAVALIPMLIVGLFAVHKTSTTLEEISRNQSATPAKNLVDTIDTVLEEEIKLARTMAVNNQIVVAASRVQTLGVDKSISAIQPG